LHSVSQEIPKGNDGERSKALDSSSFLGCAVAKGMHFAQSRLSGVGEPQLGSFSMRGIMSKTRIAFGLAVAVLLSAASALAQKDAKHFIGKPKSIENAPVLWQEPKDIATRNLFYGPGGKRDEPRGVVFTYEKEDLKGTNPKFDVRDHDGVKWKVKLGEEARPETVATRLLWAVGYATNEDYFLSSIHVTGMQPVSKKRRKRVQGLLAPDGTMHNARLKRYLKDEKKAGTWRWEKSPFSGTRELNGLRVMMALINNWDLKDQNNAVYAEKDESRDEKHKHGSEDPMVFMVSDVGASFGTAGRVRNRALAKGNVDSYRESKFIRRIDGDYVDFDVPAREPWVMAVNPKEYIIRLRLQWIGRHIPRADARWIGQLLGRLSAEQIHDAFRAGGYSPEQVEAFSRVLTQRIKELNEL
jgi:hypothetical protein